MRLEIICEVIDEETMFMVGNWTLDSDLGKGKRSGWTTKSRLHVVVQSFLIRIWFTL